MTTTTTIPTPFSLGCGDVSRTGDNGKLTYQVGSDVESCVWRITPTTSHINNLLLVLTVLFVHKGPKIPGSSQQYIALPDNQMLEESSKSEANDGSYEPISSRFSYNPNCHSAVMDAITGGTIKIIQADKVAAKEYFELKTKLSNSQLVISWSFLECEDAAPPGSLIPFGKLTCPNEMVIKDMGTTWMAGDPRTTCHWTLHPKSQLPTEMLMIIAVYYDDDVIFQEEDYVQFPDGKKVQLKDPESRKIRRFSYCTYCLSHATKIQTDYEPITSLSSCNSDVTANKEFDMEIHSSVQVSFTWTFMACDRLLETDQDVMTMDAELMKYILIVLGVVLVLFTCLILGLFFCYEKKSPSSNILQHSHQEAPPFKDDVIDLTKIRNRIRVETPRSSHDNDDVFHPEVPSTATRLAFTSEVTKHDTMMTSSAHELYATITRAPRHGGGVAAATFGAKADTLAYQSITDSAIDPK